MSNWGKTGAILQILVVAGLIGFSTWQLFLGNFGGAMSAMPVLLLFYLFLASRSRRP